MGSKECTTVVEFPLILIKVFNFDSINDSLAHLVIGGYISVVVVSSSLKDYLVNFARFLKFNFNPVILFGFTVITAHVESTG